MTHFVYKNNFEGRYVGRLALTSTKMIQKLHFSAPVVFECCALNIVEADKLATKAKINLKTTAASLESLLLQSVPQ